LASLLAALTLGDSMGWASATVLGLLAIAVASMAVFLLQERRLGPAALLDLKLIAGNKLFAAANAATLLNYTAYFGISFMLAFYMERALGMDLMTAGLVLLSMPLTMSVLAPIAGAASDRLGSRGLSTAGMLLVAAGLVGLSFLDESSSVTSLLVPLAVTGVGMGLFSTPNTSAVMGCVPRSQLGVASATVSTMRTVGQSLSLVVMGAVMASVASTEAVSAVFQGSEGALADLTYIDGMAMAYRVSADIALIGAAACLARGQPACPMPREEGRK